MLALRNQLKMLQNDTGATPAARAQARVLLDSKDWNRAFDMLIDASIQNGEWTRAVVLLEAMIGEGIPADPGKHAKLLRDAKPTFRISKHLDLSTGQRTGEPSINLEEEDRKSKTADWVGRLPGVVQKGATTWTGTVKRFLPEVNAGIDAGIAAGSASELVPAHVLCASFSPDWLDSTESSSGSGSGSSKESGISGLAASQAEAFRRIHDYHHATMHRRPIVSLSLSPKRTVIGRTAPETVNSLQHLFDTFGTPGMPRSPVYIFLRPVVAELDALLMLFSFGTSHPKDVILLRSEEAEGINSLTDECRARGDQPLSHCIASTLADLPVGVVINSSAFFANGTDLLNATPLDFETTIGAMIPSSDGLDAGLSAEVGADDSVPEEWTDWLQQQQLQRMVRCEKGTVRLDAVEHHPATSTHNVFRARVLDDKEVAVDLWLTDERGVAECD